MIGSEIGRYKIVELLGAGGMGEVYRAEDTTLGRAVALKFLAAHLLNDDEAKQRFLREARAAAAITHPNICHVYEVAEEEGKTFLAMTYLKGETLEDRIAKGPLPLKDALDLGRQVAEGLAAAHAEGIVHRDVKPANIMVSPDGRATILDFGLARLTEASKLTRADQTVGTAAYMSPEQIQGGEIDHRTDIWALGCVLYEMVVGVRPFKGQYDQALAYEVVHEEPEALTGLRTGVPVELELLVEKCLAKDAGQRYQSAAELIIDIDALKEKLKSGRSRVLRSQMSGVQRTETPVAQTAATGSKREWVGWAVAAVLGAAFAVTAGLHFGEAPPERPPLRRFTYQTPTELLRSTVFTGVAVSPDGKHIAYVTWDRKIWVQDLDRSEPRMLEGVEGVLPFWSPDSAFIGFFDSGELKKIAVDGGVAVRVCELPSDAHAGATWSPDGESIVFGMQHSGPKALFEVPSRGGTPRALIKPVVSSSQEGPTGSLARPHFLPSKTGRRALVFTFGDQLNREMMVQDLDSGERHRLGSGTHPFYSPSGHLLYQTGMNDYELWALPFSLETLQATGEAFPVAASGRSPSVTSGSATGQMLVYIEGSSHDLDRLVWLDRSGRRLGEIGRPQPAMRNPELSPDGRSVAVRARESGGSDIWIHEVDRPVARRLTFHDDYDGNAMWHPSGRLITFYSLRSGSGDLFQRAADGTDKVELLFGAAAVERAYGWSNDGRYFVYTSEDERSRDIWFLRREPDGNDYEPVEFLATPFDEDMPALSPDGRFLAYCSDASGNREVYVRPFPSGGGQWQVSTDGGSQPRWSRDGKELYYVEGMTLTGVEVTTDPTFKLTSSTRLFQNPNFASLSGNNIARDYDVSADGRFVLTEPAAGEDEASSSIRVVENWYEEFPDRKQD